MAESQDHLDEHPQSYEQIDQWACPNCFKNISPSRPPVLNEDNCSCEEVASYSNGQDVLPSQERPAYAYDTTSHLYDRNPRSYASSSISVRCQEGPEREDPNLHINNAYLPLGPDTGLNEEQHRRSASFNSNLSYQMRRFLVEPDGDQAPPYSTERSATDSRFLSQEPYIQYQSSRSGNKSSRKSMRSKPSMKSSGSGDASWSNWGVDPVTATGAWMDESGNRSTEGYPMVMSGLSEALFEGR